jgi:hypothetical protein
MERRAEEGREHWHSRRHLAWREHVHRGSPRHRAPGGRLARRLNSDRNGLCKRKTQWDLGRHLCSRRNALGEGNARGKQRRHRDRGGYDIGQGKTFWLLRRCRYGVCDTGCARIARGSEPRGCLVLCHLVRARGSRGFQLWTRDGLGASVGPRRPGREWRWRGDGIRLSDCAGRAGWLLYRHRDGIGLPRGSRGARGFGSGHGRLHRRAEWCRGSFRGLSGLGDRLGDHPRHGRARRILEWCLDVLRHAMGGWGALGHSGRVLDAAGHAHGLGDAFGKRRGSFGVHGDRDGTGRPRPRRHDLRPCDGHGAALRHRGTQGDE